MRGGEDGFACGLKAIVEASISDIPYQSLSLPHTDTQRDKYIKLQIFHILFTSFLVFTPVTTGDDKTSCTSKGFSGHNHYKI